jgi:methionyl-tRNA formyltransferase
VRLVFAGTPPVAVTALRALLTSQHTIEAVITRPDAPAGRGRRVEPSPVAVAAGELGIEVLKPVRPSDPSFQERLREIAPDCCPVTAYGALLPQPVLGIPRHGWVNLHFSVLPAWRGAAPVQYAILHGDDITGATTFQIVRELDAGPVFGVLTEPIRPADTAGDLLDRLGASGAELLVATLDGIEDGTVRALPQSAEGISLAPKLTPQDAQVDWNLPAHLIDRQIRACTPDPGAWTEFDGARIKLWPVTLTTPPRPDASAQGPAAGRSTADRLVPGEAEALSERGGDEAPDRGAMAGPGVSHAPGELHVERGAVYSGTGSYPVRLGDVQPPGKRRMPAADWARGLHAGPATHRGFS